MKHKVGIIGNYGASNLGDNLILENIVNSHPHVNWLVFCANSKDHALPKNKSLEFASFFPFGIRSFLRFKFLKSWRQLRSCRAIVLGGGTLFQDQDKKAVWLWAWQVLWVAILKKPLFIYATGVGPLETKTGCFLTKKVYQYAQKITVRDQKSLAILNKLNIAPDKITLTFDPVFGHKVEKGPPADKCFITFSLRNSILSKQKICNIFKEVIINLAQKDDSKFCFLPFQENIDRPLFDKLINHLPPEIQNRCVIITPRSAAEANQIFQKSRLALGFRLHFLILAILNKTPLVAVNYSQKVTSLLDDLELSQYGLKLKGLSADNILKKIEDASNSPTDFEINLEKYQKRAELNQEIFKNWLTSLSVES